MLISFELEMTSCGSWNGKWTGDGKRYIEVRKLNDEEVDNIFDTKEQLETSFHHNWGDGWSCNIVVKKINKNIKKELSKHFKNGFCGYNWMIENIISHQSTE